MHKAGAILKRYLPASLFGRALMIMVVPILALQIVVALLFLQRHYDRVTEQMARGVAAEIIYAVESVEAAPDPEAAKAQLDAMAGPFGFEMAFLGTLPVEPVARRAFYDLTGSVVADTLQSEVDRPIALDFLSQRKHVDARVETRKGALRILISRSRLNASKPHLLLVWMIVTGLGLIVVAAIFMRNQIRPIRELSRAAAAFGRGRSLPFRPKGAEEVRRAGQAFLDMRGRIERQIGQRTLLLSGVSHDLRTPLTRMKLALAMGEETPETAELKRDVAEMEQMLDAFLDFVSGVGAEAPAPVDPVGLAEEVAEDARRQGAEIAVYAEVETPQEREIELRRAAVKRCLTNLVKNAMRHGTRVALSVRLTPRYAEFCVEDDGPGIPEADREEALRPFTRLDQSRNQDDGSGVGLGLSIALDVARSHGGSLSLEESPRLGGLRATVVFPR